MINSPANRDLTDSTILISNLYFDIDCNLYFRFLYYCCIDSNDIFNIKVKDINKLDKAIFEQIVVKMFGGNSKKLNKIELFKKVGLIAKTNVLSLKGGRTEDTKLFAKDFDEFLDKEKRFEESNTYDCFTNHQFLCIMFEEKDDKQEFKINKFIGFKRLNFTIDFIETEVRKLGMIYVK